MKHKALFKIETQEIPRFLFASNEKKPVKRARDGAYCPIYCRPGIKRVTRTVLLMMKLGQMITNQIWEFLVVMINGNIFFASTNRSIKK